MREQVDYQLALLCSTFLASFVLYASCHFLWRRSTPLASALFLSVGFSYILGVLCTVVSALTDTPLERAPDTHQLEYGCHPGIRSCDHSHRMERTLLRDQALRYRRRAEGEVVEDRGATAREAQLQALRYQLQPHFLFNTLNAISSLVVSKQPERATEMIAKLAALLRNTLSFPEAHLVTFREELAVTEEYLSIEQVRFGPRLAVSLSVSPEASEAQVPRFLLQPIVENAIRHGIARCPNGGEVSIIASVIEGQLRIDIENDRTEGLLQSGGEGNGLGQESTKTRLEKLYGGQGSVTVTTVQNNPFSVSIQFPLTTASSIVSQGAGQ